MMRCSLARFGSLEMGVCKRVSKPCEGLHMHIEWIINSACTHGDMSTLAGAQSHLLLATSTFSFDRVFAATVSTGDAQHD